MVSLQPVYERPESELGKGKYPTAPWVIGVIAAAAVLFTLIAAFLLVRRRLRRDEIDRGPISSRGSARPGPPSSRPPGRV